MTSEVKQTPFVKQLAANDRPTRDAALASLRTYLSGRGHELTQLDHLKLWKGLFYTVWMSDRPRVQQALCDSLATMPGILHKESLVPFLRAFWQTMAREWTNIDVLRMEKFLLLVRRYLGSMMVIMRQGAKGTGKKTWEEGRIRSLLEILEETPLNVANMRLPNGLRFHVIDIYVDELERVEALKTDEEITFEKPVDLLLEPLRKLAKSSPNKTVRSKSSAALKDERLPGNESQTVEGDDQREEVTEGGAWEGFDED